jgi:Na+/proline symporter
MIWNLAIIAFISVFAFAMILTLLKIYASKSRTAGTIENFLLGGRSLGKMSIVNLLLSSSFGVNALFYAVWLGYTVGIWGLVIQGAWALSFVLLTPYSDRIRSGNSLHDFLGKKFGLATKIVAAFCSLIGIMYLIGWEVGIGETSLNLFLTSSNEMSTEQASSSTNLLIIGIVLGALVYTIVGGLKGNAAVDKLLNLLKIVVIILLTFFLLERFFSLENISFSKAMFPSLQTMKENLGVWGLITNLIFNLSWQFVDNSSWQSIIAGAETNKKETTRNLRLSGLLIFLTVGLLGTMVGVALANTPEITPDNILTQAVQLLPDHKTLLTLGMFIMITACIMSLLDGLFLASALTLVMDIFQTNKNSIWNQENVSSKKKLIFVRLALILIAFIAVWGVKLIFQITGANLFDFVYIVIITQLALFGPVLIGLATNRISNKNMWFSLIGGLIVGFGSIAVGTINEVKFLLDGAGTFTLVASLILALIISKPKKSI